MQYFADILENKCVIPGFHFMEISAPEIAGRAVPGQFLHVRVADGLYPLLRRPLSLHEINRELGSVGLLYQVRGAGTEILSRKTAGEKIDVMGPLGRGFSLDFPGEAVVLVGGGIGVAPLYPLARELIRQKKQVALLLGGQSAHLLLGKEKFIQAGCRVLTATNDGSSGFQGYVTGLLEDYLDKNSVDYVYACGPGPMLAKVEESCSLREIPGQVSLEEYMGCGVGACLSCACEKKNVEGKKYAKVCTDGPVFYFGEVNLGYEA